MNCDNDIREGHEPMKQQEEFKALNRRRTFWQRRQEDFYLFLWLFAGLLISAIGWMVFGVRHVH
jgi:hypothetical protein